MSFWKSLPFGYRGELHDVELVQFSLDLEEAARALPPPLVPRRIAGRALISLLHARLRRVGPTFLPGLIGFSYRHVAFRMLLDDGALDAAEPLAPDSAGRGVFLVCSFTDRPFLAQAGTLLTPYRLTPAEIEVDPRGLAVREGGRRLSYRKAVLGSEALSPGLFGGWAEARAVVGALDRTYAVDPLQGVWQTRILRPDWPLEPLALAGFTTDFFESARLECAFRVASVLPCHWLAPVRVSEPGTLSPVSS